jgi:predicted RNA-binding Zn-ribbon protein involved in translation (DUF1610 family)
MGLIKFNCPHCSQPLEAAEESAGSKFACPKCGQDAEVPAPAVATAPASGASDPVCSICLSPIAESDSKNACPSCNAAYHSECWTENAGCAVYGCSQAPVVESRRAIEIPVSYWGQENKNCPKCGRQILAAAVRCRHCGATFESARPQESDEFQRRTALSQRLPGAKRMIVWIFVFSLLPCFAPIGAIWGFIWSSTHRDEIQALPTIYNALSKIGLVVATGVTVIIVLMTVIFALRHS